MMNAPPDLLMDFWDEILSEEAERTRAAFARVTIAERSAVLSHLRRMTSESGWQPEQRRAARAALSALDNYTPSEKRCT